MRWLGRALLGAYLGVFAVWARDTRHVRDEQRLLIGSIEYTYEHLREAGRRPAVAVALSVWSHLGELQPLALVAKVRADDQRAAREGVGGRRAAARVAAIAASAATVALFIWGTDALGWIFWPLPVGMMAAAVWSARRRGTRWLIPLVPLLMIWPFFGLRMGFETTFVVSLLLATTLAAHRGLQRAGDAKLPWSNIVLLASVPLWWAAGMWVHGLASDFFVPGGFSETTLEGRFGLPRDETSMVLGIGMGAMVVCYWALVALVISKAANELRGRPVEGDEGAETVWL